jgi:hypothetical protein
MNDKDPITISDRKEIKIPIRNLIGLLLATSVGIGAYFAMEQRVSVLEGRIRIMQVHLDDNTFFRVHWPRGDLGVLPADERQNKSLEFLEKLLDETRMDVKKLNEK